MTRFLGLAAVFVVLIVSTVFAALNGGQRVTIDVGIMVLYRVPVTLIGFAGLFTGMVVMLVAGVHSDLKVRTILRQRLQDEDRDERAMIDRTQQDLFPADHPRREEEEVPLA
jgi:hypothetical protein